MFTKADIEKYFIAEKHAAMVLCIVACTFILLAVMAFFAGKTVFYKGIAFTVIVVAVLELAAGYVVYNSADKMRLQNVYAYDMNAGDLRTKELPRIQKTLSHLKLLNIVLVICTIAGLCGFFYFKQRDDLLTGIAAGVSLQAIFLLVFYTTSMGRVSVYNRGLTEFAAQTGHQQ